MKPFAVLAIVLSVFAAACGSTSTPTTPSNANQVKFTAALLPSNEVPAVSNAENSGSGSVNITLNVTRDASGTITAATADFSVALSGFPANTPVTLAHIHPGAAGQTGSPVVNLGLSSGEIVLSSSGAGTFTKTGINVPAATATDLIANPANYYFNVHSASNTGGFARGQLVKVS